MIFWIALIAQQAATEVKVGSLADNMQFGRTVDSTVIYAQVVPVCTVEAEQADALIDLTTRSDQVVGGITYTCNALGGFTRRVTSLNGGALRRGGQGIDYFLSQSGDGELAIPRTRLTSPLLGEVHAFPALTAGAGGLLSVQIPSVAPDLLAGEYRDTVTIEITPN